MASRRGKGKRPPVPPRKPGEPTVDVDVTADLEQFDEAVAALRKRVPMTRQEWDALTTFERERAFMVSEVAHTDVIADVFRAVDAAIANGDTLEEFRTAVNDKLATEWGGENPSRVETIFRTNNSQALNEGRHAIWSSPEIKAARPYLRRDEIEDARTCPICRKMAGVILPQDHPFWKTHSGPAHHQCRGMETALTPEEAEAAGGDDGRGPDVSFDNGFGAKPSADGDDWSPEPSDYPPAIAAVMEKRLAAGGEDD